VNTTWKHGFYLSIPRVPRDMLWYILLKFCVSEKLVDILKRLHQHFNVTFEVNSISHTIISCTTRRYPDLFAIYIAAIMPPWRKSFGTRNDVITYSPLLIFHFRKFGMEIHVGDHDNRQTGTKNDPLTFDNTDLYDINLGKLLSRRRKVLLSRNIHNQKLQGPA